MHTINSSYYEKEFVLERQEAEMLMYLYLQVAKEQKFSPDGESVDLLLEDTSLFDTVAYHVENFAKDKDGYDEIEHLFED